MDTTPERTGVIHRETLEWMGDQLACIRAEAARLSERIQSGMMGDFESEVAALESRLKSYSTKMEFEKRNALGRRR